ncbi:hypothetical protein GCM10009530_45300 [Microbispora corallina]|uniref:MarR family transcriptional regulator n=1 Tax=Microbispora corallina TaxID=83302 RepID=A0ABQ4FWK9_9ACTN|nr:hypothetical protein [Microbispora corallina]GIH39211.1 hypothetical protein Mco01_22110 [Microbispora corallina]
MPDKPLSSPQTAALLVLMVEAKEISNPELAERYGLTLTGKDRTRLNDLKLVESWKQGRSYSHLLTDAGWARVAEEFANGINAPTGSAGAALRALAAGLHRHLRRTDTSLAEIFAPDNDLPEDEAAVAAQSELKAESTQDADSTPDAESRPEVESAPDVEALIREAYRRLADGPNAWVGLARIRPLLGGATREDVDAVLRRMIGLPDVHIVPFDNQKALTPDDRDAAVVIGDQAKHLLMIGA